MKTIRFIPVAVTLLFLTLNSQLSTCFAQGSLTPPGAPAPTMKSLDQIEARTPISSAPFAISAPGSYYLTTNLTVADTNAVVITANGVTLDLNGFTISSAASTVANDATAILLAGSASGGSRDITILNGHIQGGVTNNGSGVYSGPGFGYGIYNSGNTSVNVRVTGLTVSGCLFDGIALDPLDDAGVVQGIVVEGCSALTVGGTGIVAGTVKNSTAIDCGTDGIDGYLISDCRGEGGAGYGIYATSSAFNCYGFGNGYTGLSALVAKNCNGQSRTGIGLEGATSAESCIGESDSGYGLATTSAQNCYGQSSAGIGLQAASSAENCYGKSRSNTGLNATIAQNSRGASVSGTGINATTAQNCYGSSGSGYGIYTFTAENCYGTSTNTGAANTGIGLAAIVASNCEGSSQGSGSGLDAAYGNNCYGYSAVGGTGLTATYGNFCFGQPATSVIGKYNMP